jgi:hypothetical protein
VQVGGDDQVMRTMQTFLNVVEFGMVSSRRLKLHPGPPDAKKTTAGNLTESDHTSVEVFEKRTGRWQLVAE